MAFKTGDTYGAAEIPLYYRKHWPIKDSPGLRFAGPPSLRLRRKEGLKKWMKDKRQRTKEKIPPPSFQRS